MWASSVRLSISYLAVATRPSPEASPDQLLTNLRPEVKRPSSSELSGRLRGCSPRNASWRL